MNHPKKNILKKQKVQFLKLFVAIEIKSICQTVLKLVLSKIFSFSMTVLIINWKQRVYKLYWSVDKMLNCTVLEKQVWLTLFFKFKILPQK